MLNRGIELALIERSHPAFETVAPRVKLLSVAHELDSANAMVRINGVNALPILPSP
jgi:hypothetical protein